MHAGSLVERRPLSALRTIFFLGLQRGERVRDSPPTQARATCDSCVLSMTKIGLVLLRQLRVTATSRNESTWLTACLYKGDCFVRRPGYGQTPPIHAGTGWIGLGAPID